MSAELEDLTTRGRVEIARIIETARELGDLKENGDYHAAKEEQGKMEGRIRHLENLLEKAVGDSRWGRRQLAGQRHGLQLAQPCRAVSVRWSPLNTRAKTTLKPFCWRRVEESAGDYDLLSPQSPLGAALLGAVRPVSKSATKCRPQLVAKPSRPASRLKL